MISPRDYALRSELKYHQIPSLFCWRGDSVKTVFCGYWIAV
jgi:hypothetical protein